MSDAPSLIEKLKLNNTPLVRQTATFAFLMLGLASPMSAVADTAGEQKVTTDDSAGKADGETKPKPAKRSVVWRDPVDNKIDASDFLLDHKGALPVPVVITEPAIGYGGGVMLMFFSESMAEAAESAKTTGEMAPPNITGIGGAMTENGTWGAGLVHFHTWGGDAIRYLGAGQGQHEDRLLRA